MSRLIALIIVLTTFFSCNRKGGHEHAQKEPDAVPEETTPITVPGAEGLKLSDTIRLSANEEMRYDKELFRVKAGKKVILLFRNTSPKTSLNMAHNVVVLSKGTEIADFGDAASNAKAEQYIPSAFSSSVIAHTKLLAGQESDTIEFTLTDAGVYDYICSFPGHWGTMQGKIVAE